MTAAEMDTYQARWSRQINGQERLPITQIARSERILDAFAQLLAESRGMRVLPRRSVRQARINELRDNLARTHQELAGLLLQDSAEG